MFVLLMIDSDKMEDARDFETQFIPRIGEEFVLHDNVTRKVTNVRYVPKDAGGIVKETYKDSMIAIYLKRT